MQPRRAITFSGLLASTLLVTGVVVIGFAALAAHRVGHWPFYSHPDPQNLKLPFLHIAALFSFPIAIVTLLAGMVWLIGSHTKWAKADVIVFIGAAALWCLATPGRLLNWLVD